MINVRISNAMKIYAKGELQYRLLMSMYENSRTPVKKIASDLGLTPYLVSKTLGDAEQKHNIIYTLELNEVGLGFTEGRVITIKFERTPNIELLKSRFRDDPFVQDAYFAMGDFDVLMYVVGSTRAEFQKWQYKLRQDLYAYKPMLKSSTVSQYNIGFFPLRGALLEKANGITPLEKNILLMLNENSRIKLKDLIEGCGSTQMKVIYALNSMVERGIIKRFTALTQNTDKKLIVAFGAALIPTPNHWDLFIKFCEELLKEDPHQITNDYSVVVDVDGALDCYNICTFADGDAMAKRGPDMRAKIWGPESPRIEKAILTEIIVGRWPFHLEKYGLLGKHVEDRRAESHIHPTE